MGRTGRLRRRKNCSKLKADEVEDFQCVNELYELLGSAGWRNETALIVRNLPNTGRGLCSKQAIPEGGLLISLPFQSLISLRSLELDFEFKELFGSVADTTQNALSFQALLAFYILFHKHRANSLHQSYIKSIPTSFSNPFFCSKAELYFLPDFVLERIVEQNKEIKAAYEWLSSAIARVVCGSCGTANFSTICTLDDFKWAYFAVNSRCVYIEPRKILGLTPNSFFQKLIKDEPKLALAPFLDLFNHSDSTGTVSELSDRNPPRYELRSHQPYRRYEQTFISYGDLPNVKLLIDYGFYLPANRHDFFELNLADIEISIKSQKRSIHRNKFKFIKDHNLDSEMFVHCIDGCSHNLKVVLYLVFIEESPFPNVLNEVAFGATDHFDDSVRNEVEELIRIKVVQFEEFVRGLKGVGPITESGKVVLGYLNECILYLKKFLTEHFENF